MKYGYCVGGPLHGHAYALDRGVSFFAPVTGRVSRVVYYWHDDEFRTAWRFQNLTEPQFRTLLAEVHARQLTYRWAPEDESDA